MAESGTVISFGVFQWVVTGLLAVCVAGGGFFLSGLKTDVSDMRKDVNSNHIELVKSIGDLKVQMIEGNSQLRLLVQETRQQRR